MQNPGISPGVGVFGRCGSAVTSGNDRLCRIVTLRCAARVAHLVPIVDSGYCMQSRARPKWEAHHEGGCSRSRGDRRLRRGRAAPRRDRGAPDRPAGPPRGDARARRPRAEPARRLHRAPARHGRPGRRRRGRLRFPWPESEFLRHERSAPRAAAGPGDGGRRRAERHPVVVLPRPEGASARRPPRRDGRPGRRGDGRAGAASRDRLRRLLLDGDRGTRRDPAPGRHPVLPRRTGRRDLRALHGLERGDGRRMASRHRWNPRCATTSGSS